MPGEEIDLLALLLQDLAQGIGDGVLVGLVGHLAPPLVVQQHVAGKAIPRLLGLEGFPLGVHKAVGDLGIVVLVELHNLFGALAFRGALGQKDRQGQRFGDLFEQGLGDRRQGLGLLPGGVPAHGVPVGQQGHQAQDAQHQQHRRHGAGAVQHVAFLESISPTHD